MDETNEKKLDLILKKVDLETPSDPVRWRSKRDKAGRESNLLMRNIMSAKLQTIIMQVAEKFFCVVFTSV
jgi:hypothetical protein